MFNLPVFDDCSATKFEFCGQLTDTRLNRKFGSMNVASKSGTTIATNFWAQNIKA